MNTTETPALAPKTLVLIAYGSAKTQAARVVSVNARGNLVVDRFIPGKESFWTKSESVVKAEKVFGLLPLSDPRHSAALAMIEVAARPAR